MVGDVKQGGVEKKTGTELYFSADRNPNTNGARLILGLANPGERLRDIANGVANGQIKALIALGEDPTEIGISPASRFR